MPSSVACVRVDLAAPSAPAPAPLWTTAGAESKLGTFLSTLCVWAIGLTSCFVYSRRLHREKRARTGAFIFISVRAISILTPCLFNQRTDLRQLPGKGKAERYSHHRTRTGRRHERHPRAGRGHPHDAIRRYQEALHPGRARVPKRSGVGAGKFILFNSPIGNCTDVVFCSQGRPRISAFSPVVFDVKLLYIPGLE